MCANWSPLTTPLPNTSSRSANGFSATDSRTDFPTDFNFGVRATKEGAPLCLWLYRVATNACLESIFVVWLRTPASKVSLWCGSQHRPKHFNEGTYTVVADCDSDLRDRFALCQHLKRSKQPRLLPPTAKLT